MSRPPRLPVRKLPPAGPTLRCPHAKGWFKNPQTGLIQPRPCGTSSCGRCGFVLAVQTEAAIALGRPRQSAVLSAILVAPFDIKAAFQAFRDRIRQLAHEIRHVLRRRFEYVWVAELVPPRNYHVHLLHRGNRISPSEMRQLWGRFGGAWGQTQTIKSPDAVSQYVMKNPLQAGGLDYEAAAAILNRHLELNGGRLEHHSRNYFRDERGRPVARIREAREAARRAYRAGKIARPPLYARTLDPDEVMQVVEGLGL